MPYPLYIIWDYFSISFRFGGFYFVGSDLWIAKVYESPSILPDYLTVVSSEYVLV